MAIINCNEIGQYIAHLKAIFMDNCKHIKPKDLEMMIDLMDAIRRCGKDGGGGEPLPEDVVLYTPQQKEEYQKAIARLNIGAVSNQDVIDLINDHIPDLLDVLGVEFTVNKQDDLTPDGTGTKYPTVDAVNTKFQELEDDISNVSGDKNFIYNQNFPSATWEIIHNLNKKPSVTITDSANTVVEGQIIINDGVKVVITFNAPFTGTAILN